MEIIRIQHEWPVYVNWSVKLTCRGMFATHAIKKGELVEPCPVILIAHTDEQKRKEARPTGTIIDNYYYDWNKKFWCLPLGYSMLYNHSYTPNMVYKRDFKRFTLNYVALKNVLADEELTVNYNGDPNDKTPIDSWFKEYYGKKIV